MTNYTEEDIGNKIMVVYPQGTRFETVIVERTCRDCGATFIGPLEEVAHILAQHSIIHKQEEIDCILDTASLDDNEVREMWEYTIHGLVMAFEQGHAPKRKLLDMLRYQMLDKLELVIEKGDKR